MLPDEIEFIIAKAKLDVELKFNEDQPRDENGRFAETDGGSALTVPDWVSPNNLVSATAPHVGLSPKAKEVAARINGITQTASVSDDNGNKVTTHTATYTTEAGKEYKLVSEEMIRPDGMVQGMIAVNPQDGAPMTSASWGQTLSVSDGVMDYGTDRFHVNESETLISKIYNIGSRNHGEGVATAMLEFARATSTTAVMHARTLTDMGAGFAESVKGVTVKFSPDQLRDENGRFTVDGGSGTYKPGRENWKRVDPSELVARDMELQIAAAKANGKPFTEEEVKMHQKWSEMFYQKNFVMKNGSTMVYAQKATPQSDRAGISVTKDDFSNVMQQIDRLQQYAPLDDISVYINGGSDRVAAASALKTGDGTAIQLNLNSMLNDAIMISADKTEGNSMPAETSENSMEFTLAHEWGHAFDYAKSTDNNDISLNTALRVAARDLANGVSDYAKTSNQEMYAELFAQHYMEQVHGMPPIPATQAASEFLK